MQALQNDAPKRGNFRKAANTVRNALRIRNKHETSILVDSEDEEEIEDHLNQYFKQVRKIKDVVLAVFVLAFLFWFEVQAELNNLTTLSYYLLIWISVISTYVVFRIIILKKGKRGLLKRFLNIFTRRD